MVVPVLSVPDVVLPDESVTDCVLVSGRLANCVWVAVSVISPTPSTMVPEGARMVPDCTINGAAAGDVVHLIAELIDNALRYSPPASPVRVSASQRGDGAVELPGQFAVIGLDLGVIVPGLPRAVPELHIADAPLQEPAGDQGLSTVDAGAVEVAGRL